MPRVPAFLPGVTLVALAVVAAVTAAWTARRQDADAAPYARWRNGVIVYVRNCEPPAGDDAELRCAALRCAQRVTELLTNAQQAKVSLTRYARSADGAGFEVEGELDQYLRAPTLPTGFTCRMPDYRRATPEFVFGTRQAAGTL